MARKTKSHREVVNTGRDKRFVRRDEEGRFDNVVDVGKSLAQDRKQTAKHKAAGSIYARCARARVAVARGEAWCRVDD